MEAKFGQVTMLINNAGVVHENSIINSDPAQTEATFRTNTLAHLWVILFNILIKTYFNSIIDNS